MNLCPFKAVVFDASYGHCTDSSHYEQLALLQFAVTLLGIIIIVDTGKREHFTQT